MSHGTFRIFLMHIITSVRNTYVNTFERYPPSHKAANFSWRMNAERVSAKDVLAMRRIGAFMKYEQNTPLFKAGMNAE